MSDVAHPHAACDWINSTFKGQEVAVGSPISREEGTNTGTKSWIELRDQILVKEFVWQWNVCDRSDGFAIKHQRLAGVDGVHQLGGRQRHMKKVAGPGK